MCAAGRERWAGTERADPFGGAVVDGEIWGRGAGDLKAGICATLAAARLLRRRRVCRLPREILFAFVGDEESGEPGSGVSAGMKAFVAEIEAGAVPRPDIAVYVEPTQLNVYAAQMGFLICDITVTGKLRLFRRAGARRRCAEGRPCGAVGAVGAFGGAGGAARRIRWSGGRSCSSPKSKAGGYIAVPGECRLSLILQADPRPEPRRRRAPRWRRRCARRRSRPAIAHRLRLSRRPRPRGRRHADGDAGRRRRSCSLLMRGDAQRAAGSAARSRARPTGPRRRSLRRGSACRPSIARPATSATAIRSRSASSSSEYFDGIVAFAAFLARVGARQNLTAATSGLSRGGSAMMTRITKPGRRGVLQRARRSAPPAFAGETVGPDGEKATPAARTQAERRRSRQARRPPNRPPRCSGTPRPIS